MPNYEIVEPYKDVIRREIGKTGMTAENITQLFNNIYDQCPEVIKDRPLAQRHEVINFGKVMESLRKDFQKSAMEVENMVVANPYLLFEDLEETPVERNRKKSESHTSVSSGIYSPSIRRG